MDVHRCRFVPYPAPAINAVAFTHPSLSGKSPAQVRLAIGRANGDIEIWNPTNAIWHQEVVIPGGHNRSVDGLVWVTDADEEMSDGKMIPGKSRLFSIGYTNTVTEWDLEKGRAKKHARGQHGDIWCLAAQPPSGDGSSNVRRLVSGTVDGSLILYSLEDDDLRLQRVLAKTHNKKIKMVSLAFQSRHTVVVGCSDSTIRVYDIRNGTVLRQMTLGSDLSGGPKDIIVWCVKSLPNGDIVSGDSTGQIRIWDGKTYTQAQRIQSHSQDVLSLAINARGSRIISGGMDRRTVLYEPMQGGSEGRWSKVWHRRYHSHDVKAMASFEGKNMSVVVSGGPDATPIICPIRGAGKEEHRTLSHLPQSTPVISAPKVRLVLSWWEREVHIWELLKPASEIAGVDEVTPEIGKNRRLLGRILIKGDSNITSAAISHDGTLLIVSTISEVKAFQLRLQHGIHKNELKIKTAGIVGNNGGASKVAISPDKTWVCWVEEGSRVVLARVTAAQTEGAVDTINRLARLSRLERKIPKHLQLGAFGTYQRNITQIAFSPDSKMLAVADLFGYVDTWVLRGSQEPNNSVQKVETGDASDTSSDDSDDEDQDGAEYQWKRNSNGSLIPRLPAAPVVLSFSSDWPGERTSDNLGNSDDYTLLAITSSSDLLVFNPLAGSLSDWSRRNPSAKLPEQFRVTKDLVKGVLWQGTRAWLYGASFLFMLDLSQHLCQDKISETTDAEKKGVKRKREGANSGAGDRMKKPSLAPHVIKMAAGNPEEPEWMDLEIADADEQKSNGEDDEDEEDDSSGGELQQLRDAQAAADGDSTSILPPQRPSWWHTYKYRPILGIAPLWSESQEGRALDEGPELPPLEVALVERPIWDVDLPPRYLADGE